MTATLPGNPPTTIGERFVSYSDLSGGLNTKRDPHALDRNQLAISQNTWYGTETAVSKRPGTAAVVTANGATGTGLVGTGISAGRFANVSTLLSQQGTALQFANLSQTSWTNISTALGSNPNRIHTAQMYDPTNATSSTADGTMVICDGVSPPWFWLGPGNTTLGTVATTSGFLPVNFGGSNPITPKYVISSGQNSNLVYAGEPTFPNAVYISDPFFPEKFSFSATNTTSYPGTYSPYIIGQNDGINGGDITGLCLLGTTIVVFKQAAIYFMQLQSVYGDMVFTSFCVSSSTGCVAPESIVSFDQFACFLGNDGAYTIDIYGNVQQISRDVPTFFDNTLTGYVAKCVSPSTAVGVRSGSRYILFYDATNPATGHPTQGLWFDFAKPAKSGLPTVGEIIGAGNGYAVAGAVQLKGPKDDGNFVWTSAVTDQIGKFGIGFSDFGSAISVSGMLKADMFTETGEEAPVSVKTLQRIWLDVAVPQQVTSESLIFQIPVTADFLNEYIMVCPAVTISLPTNSLWGSGVWGSMVWQSSSPGGNTQYINFTPTQTQGLQGRTLQFGFQETSTLPWNLLGITAKITVKPVAK